MPVWAAARCTSAALPFFKAFTWQGQMLIDGGFQLNCPAASAVSEAKCIWPDKRCDILLSLGTGTPETPDSPSSHNFAKMVSAIAHRITDATGAWVQFRDNAPRRHSLFRLNPEYRGRGFAFDAFQKLDEIERQAGSWIGTAGASSQIGFICDQLIASLFFFRSVESTERSTFAGEILCRLPVDLPARQNLIDGMLKESDLNLFMVQYSGRGEQLIHVAESLRNVRPGHELRIIVKPSVLPTNAGRIDAQIKMRNLGRDACALPRWSPISGSPYVLQEDRGKEVQEI
jgi:hypothetical protein